MGIITYSRRGGLQTFSIRECLIALQLLNIVKIIHTQKRYVDSVDFWGLVISDGLNIRNFIRKESIFSADLEISLSL